MSVDGRCNMPLSSPRPCRFGVPVEYKFIGEDFKVTDEMKEVFDWDGAILIRGLFSKTELRTVEDVLLENKHVLDEKSHGVPDGNGRLSKLLLWYKPGDDVTGLMGRSEKLMKTAAELLGGDVYHYHSKLMMKEPNTGGAHVWHQDYGYWYHNGFIRPDLLTAFIAVDKCVEENGRLQVILGSNRCGRVEHDGDIGQQRANDQRVEQIKKEFAHVHIDMEPGDCLFFHCNVLHCSGPNHSDMRRWAFLTAYNRIDNQPFLPSSTNGTESDMVPNSAMLDTSASRDMSKKDFIDPLADHTVKAKLARTGFH